MEQRYVWVAGFVLSVGLACAAEAVVPPLAMRGGRLGSQERAEKVVPAAQPKSPEQALRRLEEDHRRLDNILQDLKDDEKALRRALSKEVIKGDTPR